MAKRIERSFTDMGTSVWEVLLGSENKKLDF